MPQCKTCGLLAIRHHLSFRPIEVIEEWRKNGRYNPPDGRAVPAQLFCQARSSAFPPRPLKGEHEPGIDDAVLTQRQIENDIDCDEWMEWNWGDSPKKHLKMRALQEQREYNERIIAGEREWREQERKARESEAEKTESRHRENYKATERRFWLGFLGAATVAILTQLFIAWIKPDTQPPVVNVTIPPAQVIAQPSTEHEPTPAID